MEAVVAPNQPVANAGEAGQAQQQPRGESFLAIAKSLILRALIIYFITSMFRRPQTPTTGPGQTGTVQRQSSSNLYANGTIMDLYVFVSENPETPDFENADQPVWVLRNVLYGEWTGGPNNDGIHEFETELPLSTTVQNNGSYYLHTYLVRNGDDPKTHLNHKYTIHRSKQLNKYKKRRYSRTVNLLTGTTTATQEEIMKADTIKEEVVSHWHPNVTLNIINDYTAWTQGAVPSPLDQFVEFTSDGEYYKPILYVNDYWNLAKDYQPINTTVKSVPLRITWQPLSMFKWQLYAAQSMRNQWSQGGPLGALLTGGETPAGDLDEEQDSLKEAMLDTNPYLLGLTIVVSIVHSVFEFLAFKNDIQFWRNRESLEGLSVRSVFFNVFQSVVVMLYVFDNDTNTLIRISCVIGLGIEIWKIQKVVNVKVDRENRLLGFIPLSITEKSSYVSSHTKEYDTQAFRYLSWALYPLLVGYAIYSLVYEEHKGWYSWVLSMLYGFLLTFGFIMMTPQLFINYKLKSVAHLPWRMMTYKALNTFIDDIFAFIIRMPTLYRLGCFRDDIVFFIFLYQRWYYRVDPSRVNEFGYSQEMLEQSKGAQPDNNAAAAIAASPGEQETEEQPKPLDEKKNE